METPIARAFVMLLMQDDQIKLMKTKENQMSPGRYLVPFEIMRTFGIGNQTISEEREAKMKLFYGEWQKKNWLKTQIEEKNHEKLCAEVKTGWCKCRTPQQELHEWMDYVKANWFEPLPTASKRKTTDKFQNTDENGVAGNSRKAKQSKQTEVDKMSQVQIGME